MLNHILSTLYDAVDEILILDKRSRVISGCIFVGAICAAGYIFRNERRISSLEKKGV